MTTESVLKVHRIRFFVAEMTSINAMSYNADNDKLAVVRRRIRKYKTGQSDTQSVVDVWNMSSKAPFVEQTICDNSDNPSLLEALLWTPNSRLFSCGLNSCINEYDLKNSRIKRSYSVRSGAVWCMCLDATKSLIAVGTEDAMICVYRIEEESLELEKVMDRNDSRILCLEWHRPADNTPPLIITGSVDYIKIWNYQTGRCIDNIKVGSDGVVIWCLVVLQDFTIISGDSNGTTSFWDGKANTLITSYCSHKADVLSVCVDNDESNVYSSGVDPIIVKFTRTMNSKYSSWTNSTTRRLHTHDVRALVCVKPNWLLSAGIDTYLTQSCYPPNLEIRHLNDFSSKVTIINGYVLLQYESFVQIWKLGNSDEDLPQTNQTIEMLELSECASKLADIKSRKPIIKAAFNDKWIAYANYDNIKIKSWTESNVEKVPLLYEPIANTNHLTFCGKHFLAIASGTTLSVLKLDVLGVILQTRIDLKNRIHSMTASDKYLAICTTDPKRLVTIYSVDNWSPICDFANSLLPTVMQINTFSTGDLWVAYANHKIMKYSIKNQEIVKSVRIQEAIPNQLYQSIDDYWPVKQMAFATNAVLFSDDNNLFKLDTNSYKINKCDKYRHIIRLGNGTNLDELIVVELTPEMVFSFLPKCLAKKRFGT